jgi:hypothetical protein
MTTQKTTTTNNPSLLSRIIALPRMSGGGIRLATVRAGLPEYSFKAMDAALMELYTDGQIALSRFEDPATITPEDKAAALSLGCGIVRHCVYPRSHDGFLH